MDYKSTVKGMACVSETTPTYSTTISILFHNISNITDKWKMGLKIHEITKYGVEIQ